MTGMLCVWMVTAYVGDSSLFSTITPLCQPPLNDCAIVATPHPVEVGVPRLSTVGATFYFLAGALNTCPKSHHRPRLESILEHQGSQTRPHQAVQSESRVLLLHPNRSTRCRTNTFSYLQGFPGPSGVR